MRQITVRVPRGSGQRVLDIASANGGTDMALHAARSGDGEIDVVTIHCGNSAMEDLLDALEPLPELRITIAPRGVIALRPPASEAAEQATDVEPLSPIEVFLSGLQSIGSWPAFLGYAAAGGVVVWIGLFTGTVFLLIGAMLIAPFAAPAMNAALATARGDALLFRRSLLRYFAALAVTIAIAFLLSVVLRQTVATPLMVDNSVIPSVALLLPLVAGAAGALNLCQSERSSLVSGAATGVLVAASLAPPAGIVGMAAAIGEWTMVKSGIFLLLLQIVGINLSGAIVFRIYGVTPRGARYDRGRSRNTAIAGAATLAALAGLLVWQFSVSPELLRSTTAQRATADVRHEIRNSGIAKLLQAEAEFTRGDIPGQNSLLITAYVQGDSDRAEAIRSRLVERVKRRIVSEYDVTPLVDITVLEP